MSCAQMLNIFQGDRLGHYLHLATDLRELDLTDINFSRKSLDVRDKTIQLDHATLTRRNFSGAFVERVALPGAEISDSDWSFAHVNNTDFTNATMNNVKLVGANFGKNNKFENTTMTLALPAVWTDEALQQHFNPGTVR